MLLLLLLLQIIVCLSLNILCTCSLLLLLLLLHFAFRKNSLLINAKSHVKAAKALTFNDMDRRVAIGRQTDSQTDIDMSTSMSCAVKVTHRKVHRHRHNTHIHTQHIHRERASFVVVEGASGFASRRRRQWHVVNFYKRLTRAVLLVSCSSLCPLSSSSLSSLLGILCLPNWYVKQFWAIIFCFCSPRETRQRFLVAFICR